MTGCFNPRPSSLTGEPNLLCAGVNSSLGFNPRPSSLTGEPPGQPEQRAGQPCFNPRPSSLTGEPADLADIADPLKGFNPRPSSLTGEPEGEDFPAGRILVSIRARHR